MEEITYRAQLIAKNIDFEGYITYVFQNLNNQNLDDKYIMCVQFPNWNQSNINLGEIGYISVRYVKEGISQWYDGKEMHVYRYTNIIFLKFIKEPKNVNMDFMVD